MTLRIKNLVLRNFLSVGNVAQAIQLDSHPLTLVLGHNLDTAGNNVRNGAGKTTILQAISYALFGKPLTQIKADNLVNNVNTKGMLVTIEFERDGTSYRIERGRKPAILRWFVNQKQVIEPEDESQGDSRNTQKDIERVLGFSHGLFRHIVALNTFTDPFLKMKAADQRETIEELLGITQISAKAEQLKELVKGTKDAIKEEEFRIKAVTDSNQRVQNTISDLELKSRVWQNERARKLKTAREQLQQATTLDVEAELAAHKALADFTEQRRTAESAKRELRLQFNTVLNEKSRAVTRAGDLEHEREHLRGKTCPTCRQPIQTDTSDREAALEQELAALIETIRRLDAEETEFKEAINGVDIALANLRTPPTTFYPEIAKAYEHRACIDRLAQQIEREEASVDPYEDQVVTLRAEGIETIDYAYLNEINALLKHQEFLHKLLTSKDSFIRKKIVDQNLAYLNHRLNHYLEKLGLPHEVQFKSDLSVEITLLGRDFDFEQLSRGEMNRVILATSWSFRDMWENLNQTINLMFVDEMIDNGLDEHGAESALDVLKHMSRERGKNVLLISHKDELISRVSRILLVRKENGFTHFDSDIDALE